MKTIYYLTAVEPLTGSIVYSNGFTTIEAAERIAKVYREAEDIVDIMMIRRQKWIKNRKLMTISSAWFITQT